MNISNRLFSFIVVFCSLLLVLLMFEFRDRFNMATRSYSSNDSIIVYDTPADWTTVPNFCNRPHPLKEDLNNYPLSNETTILFEIYDMLDINYDIQDFYTNYLNIDMIETEKQQGKCSPELIWAVSNTYFENNDINIKCKDLYNTNIYTFFNIAKNKYPIMTWYANNYNGPSDYGWQYIDPIIVFNTDENMITYYDLKGNQISIAMSEFYPQWLNCGGFALVFGNYKI